MPTEEMITQHTPFSGLRAAGAAVVETTWVSVLLYSIKHGDTTAIEKSKARLANATQPATHNRLCWLLSREGVAEHACQCLESIHVVDKGALHYLERQTRSKRNTVAERAARAIAASPSTDAHLIVNNLLTDKKRKDAWPGVCAHFETHNSWDTVALLVDGFRCICEDPPAAPPLVAVLRDTLTSKVKEDQKPALLRKLTGDLFDDQRRVPSLYCTEASAVAFSIVGAGMACDDFVASSESFLRSRRKENEVGSSVDLALDIIAAGDPNAVDTLVDIMYQSESPMLRQQIDDFIRDQLAEAPISPDSQRRLILGYFDPSDSHSDYCPIRTPLARVRAGLAAGSLPSEVLDDSVLAAVSKGMSSSTSERRLIACGVLLLYPPARRIPVLHANLRHSDRELADMCLSEYQALVPLEQWLDEALELALAGRGQGNFRQDTVRMALRGMNPDNIDSILRARFTGNTHDGNTILIDNTLPAEIRVQPIRAAVGYSLNRIGQLNCPKTEEIGHWAYYARFELMAPQREFLDRPCRVVPSAILPSVDCLPRYGIEVAGLIDAELHNCRVSFPERWTAQCYANGVLIVDDLGIARARLHPSGMAPNSMGSELFSLFQSNAIDDDDLRVADPSFLRDDNRVVTEAVRQKLIKQSVDEPDSPFLILSKNERSGVAAVAIIFGSSSNWCHGVFATGEEIHVPLSSTAFSNYSFYRHGPEDAHWDRYERWWNQIQVQFREKCKWLDGLKKKAGTDAISIEIELRPELSRGVSQSRRPELDPELERSNERRMQVALNQAMQWMQRQLRAEQDLADLRRRQHELALAHEYDYGHEL